jgi:predicted solute-binding protein
MMMMRMRMHHPLTFSVWQHRQNCPRGPRPLRRFTNEKRLQRTIDKLFERELQLAEHYPLLVVKQLLYRPNFGRTWPSQRRSD